MTANSFYNLIEVVNPFNDPMKILPYMMTAVMGTWCVCSLPWQKLNGSFARFMEYVGNHTLTILTWHFLCFKLISLAVIGVYGIPIERLAEFPVIGEYTNSGWFVLYTFVGVGLPLSVNFLYNRFFVFVNNIMHA